MGSTSRLILFKKLPNFVCMPVCKSRYSRCFNSLRPVVPFVNIIRKDTDRTPIQYFSTAVQVEDDNLTANQGEKLKFKTETRMLLDIVAKSLYSENEVFLRELISNASDALEKFRYAVLRENLFEDVVDLRIQIRTNKQDQTLIIEDNGIGMTREELVNNIGTIASSGSKAFLEELKKNKSVDSSKIIGQFGVGFYSCFVVAKKVDVYTRAKDENSIGYCWSYEGSDQYEIRKVDDLPRGTKIVVHLKPECREFSDNNKVREIIKKYSNFINCPIIVDDEKCNTIQPLWLSDPKSVTEEQYNEFYRFVSNSYDKPRFKLHYSTDAPLTIKALLFVPSKKPVLSNVQKEVQVSLYAKRVLIKNKAIEILPEWCYFLEGVVDSEDIPLNLSRELLQNSPLIAKLRNVIANRVIKFLLNCANKEPSEYQTFYNDYHLYLKSGIMSSDDISLRENLAELLRFETSKTKPGEMKSLTQYCSDLPANDQTEIFYLFAPSRATAETSPYSESLKKKGFEVLYCYGMFDEYVFLRLNKFKGKSIKSAENEMKEKSDEEIVDFGPDALQKSEIDSLLMWSKEQLKDKIREVKITSKLQKHPCVVTLEDSAAARHMLKIPEMRNRMNEETQKALFAPNLELNPKHPIIKKLFVLISSNPKLANLLLEQLLANAMLTADLVQDAGSVIVNMNELLTEILEKL